MAGDEKRHSRVRLRPRYALRARAALPLPPGRAPLRQHHQTPRQTVAHRGIVDRRGCGWKISVSASRAPRLPGGPRPTGFRLASTEFFATIPVPGGTLVAPKRIPLRAQEGVSIDYPERQDGAGYGDDGHFFQARRRRGRWSQSDGRTLTPYPKPNP